MLISAGLPRVCLVVPTPPPARPHLYLASSFGTGRACPLRGRGAAAGRVEPASGQPSAPGSPDGPAASVWGDSLWRALSIRGSLVATATRDPPVRPGRGGSSEGVSAAARPGRGGAGGWAALNPRGARAGASPPADSDSTQRSPTPLARAQAGSRYTSAHTALHTHPDRPSLCHSGLPLPPAPRTLLACFSVYALTPSPPTLDSCQALGLSGSLSPRG